MSKARLRPPSGFASYLSRRDVAERLGFASEFKVRQLERQGRLRPVRGAMGSAWYAPEQVSALSPVSRDRPGPSPSPSCSDAAIVAHLRGRSDPGDPPRTVVDVVADLGVPISRAQRVYRFWLAHDLHPSAERARALRGARGAPVPVELHPERPGERRSGERLERDTLLKQLRDPDPKIRAAAFEKLKTRR